MSRDVTFYIVDIFLAAEKVSRYTSRFENAQAFLHSELEWDAAIRELEIIGEATNKLLKADMLDESYRLIVDFRNRIVHGYFGIDETIVWDIATSLLPLYLQELEQLIDKNRLNLCEAIENARNDFAYSKHSVALLQSLSEKYRCR